MIQTRRPVSVVIIFFILLLPAVFSYLNIPIEIYPSAKYPRLTIVTNWRGASPELIVKEISIPVEEEAARVRGVKKISSRSRNGSSNVSVEFVEDTDIHFARFELNEKLRRIRKSLPLEANAPQIQDYRPREMRRISEDISVKFIGDYSLIRLKKIVAEHIKSGIEGIEGVAEASVHGGREEEILIELDTRRLDHFQINPLIITQAIEKQNKSRIGGAVIKDSGRFFIRLGGRLTDLKEIENIVIDTAAGKLISIGDLGGVSISGKEIMSISRTNGLPEVSISIEMETQSNVVRVSTAVRKKLDHIVSEIPYKIGYEITHDPGKNVSEKINKLLFRVGLILAIIIILLLVLLRDLRSFVILITAVFLTEAATFNLLYFTGISVNFITLAALAIGLGIVIDNSIVILENIYRKMEKFADIREAAAVGVREMIKPVLASTLTTLAVFIPFVHFSERLREHYVPLAYALAYSILCSLLVSIFFIPAASVLFLKGKGKKRLRREHFRFYRKFTAWSLDKKYIVILILVIIGYYSLEEFSEVDTGRWFSRRSDETLSVRVHLPEGSEISRADTIIKKFEKEFVSAQGVKTVQVRVWPMYAQLSVDFLPDQIDTATPYTLREKANEIALQHAGVTIGVSGFGDYLSAGGMMYDRPGSNQIIMRGYNLDELNGIAEDISRRITSHIRVREVKRSTSVNRWYSSGSIEELIIRPRRERISFEGVKPIELFYSIRSALGMINKAGRILMPGNRMLDINIREKNAGNRQLDDLNKMFVISGGKKSGRIKDFCETRWQKTAEEIYRENQQYLLNLNWEFRGPPLAGRRYFKAIYNSIQLPPGYKLDPPRTYYMTSEEQEEIYTVVIISLVAIFMILASLYESFLQPFVIFFAIPFALIGVFLIFSWTGSSFDSSAYIGVILLCGMVVNNSIIMVDRYNLLLASGMKLRKALIEGTFSRIRPIILTTATTVGGLLPIIFTAQKNHDDIWYNLSLAAVGGLISSALFTITLIPVVYALFMKLKDLLNIKKDMYRLLWTMGLKK